MADLEQFDRPMLATLCREYLLCGHLIDRSGMAHVLAAGGIDAMREVAIEEWMGASPVYTGRIRRALGIDGHAVTDIFKAMQIDIGAPPQFMDFRYEVTDDHHGEFTLASCGALRDVEPMGDEYVVTMCHHIEDPTFDATATATNPRARMRPVHRPPRTPADQLPHCQWTVTIDEDADALPVPEAAERMSRTRAAQLVLPPYAEDGDGRVDYRGSLQPDVAFESFSRATLLMLLDEIALQWHLLALSFADACERRFDAATARDIRLKQLTGIAGLTAQRLQRVLSGRATVGDILDVHPLFRPRAYVDVRIDGNTVEVRDCPALGDTPGRSWIDLIAEGETAPLDAIHAVIERPDERPPREVAVTRVSTGADFDFEAR